MSYSVCHPLTDIVKMRCFTADNTSKNNNSIETVILSHHLCTINEFKATRNSLNMNILWNSTMLLECLYSTIKQGTSNLRIPLSYNDTKAHVTCIWYTLRIVVG